MVGVLKMEETIYASLMEGQRIVDLVEKIKKQNYLDSDTLEWCEQIEERVDALFRNAYENANQVWEDYTDTEDGLV